MIGDGGEKDPEDDRYRTQKARCEHQRENLCLVADLGEADHQARNKESFHRSAVGVGRDMSLGMASSPDPGAGSRCQRSRQTDGAACTMAEAKYVDTGPAIVAGGYSPMTADL